MRMLIRCAGNVVMPVACMESEQGIMIDSRGYRILYNDNDHDPSESKNLYVSKRCSSR